MKFLDFSGLTHLVEKLKEYVNSRTGVDHVVTSINGKKGDVTIDNASSEASGLMSSTDKAKLDTFTGDSIDASIADAKKAGSDASALVKDLDVAAIGGTDKVITSISQTDGRIAATPSELKTVNGVTLFGAGNITLGKEDVGLNNVTNDAQVKRSEMGVASGVATLDENGLVPSSQLPSYVDDVIEAENKTSLPTKGEAGKIYVTLNDNLTYRWSGTDYVEISASLALGETSSTAYPGDKGKANADAIKTLETEVDKKVDKEIGKGLSTNDYTTAEKTKLAGIAEGATADSAITNEEIDTLF